MSTTAYALPVPAGHPQSSAAPLVIGLDLSLSSTGVAGDGWADALRTKDRGHDRLDWLCREIAERVRAADLVVVEGPAYGRGAQGGHHELAGFWWMVVHNLWTQRIPYAVVNPHSRTIYAVGRANPAQEHPREKRARIAKGMVRDAAAARYGVECEGPGRYDQADALILAAMGLDWLGHPLAEVPLTHRRALDGVDWTKARPSAV
jgi:hypothetical protein